MFEFEEYIMEEMIKQVPHRHIIFCLPKILRHGFMRNRKYLNDLSRMAWASTREFMQATLGRKGVPGGIQQIQTHGNVLNANAHIHSLATDGLFEENGVFYCMPEYTGKARQCLQKLFEKKIYDFALKNRIATEETIARMQSWMHSGFSVYAGERIYWHKGDKKEINLRHVIRYMNKSFYSGEKIIYNEEKHKIFYKGNTDHGVPLPVPAGSGKEKPGYATFTCEDPRFHEDKLYRSRDSAYSKQGAEVHKLLRPLFFQKPWTSGGCCNPQRAVRQGERPETSYRRTETL